jgi:Outer membrane protein beta-barrel domain
MKALRLIGIAALLAAPTAFAGDMPKGSIAGYATMSELDFEGVGKDDGTGFGIRGWATVSEPFFVHGEYQTTKVKLAPGSEGDLESLRLGGGFVSPMGDSGSMWIGKVELVDFGSDTDEDGFGFHGGAMLRPSPQFGLYGTLGYLMLNDTDGLEFNLGASVSFSKELAAVLDYRAYMGEYDVSGVTGDFEVTDLRLGLAYMFY